jgi:L-asparaginase II
MSMAAELMCEIWRGSLAESCHFGHAVICDGEGQVVQAWGDPDAIVFPRSSAKMLLALPLVTSGAARLSGLRDTHLALACASHEGAPLHIGMVTQWLEALNLDETALRCGPQPSRDADLRRQMVMADEAPCQLHNNCSGKHAGFLTLSRHLGAGAEYIDPDHPVSLACLEAFEEMTGQTSPISATDGCSAPNPATTMAAMAHAMARFASAHRREDIMSRAAARLTHAMYSNPMQVAGMGRACTELMQAVSEPVALKTGAEGYFVAILPGRELGVAVKIADGATRAAECAITAILVRLGVLDPLHPAALRRMNAPITNWRGIRTGTIRPAAQLLK